VPWPWPRSQSIGLACNAGGQSERPCQHMGSQGQSSEHLPRGTAAGLSAWLKTERRKDARDERTPGKCQVVRKVAGKSQDAGRSRRLAVIVSYRLEALFNRCDASLSTCLQHLEARHLSQHVATRVAIATHVATCRSWLQARRDLSPSLARHCAKRRPSIETSRPHPGVSCVYVHLTRAKVCSCRSPWPGCMVCRDHLGTFSRLYCIKPVMYTGMYIHPCMKYIAVST
jgi:hypothetical protein